MHLGITEAGLPREGTIKSAIGLGVLLWEGIGDTLRCSLAADPIEEVPVCWGILKALGIREKGFDITACPSCGSSAPPSPTSLASTSQSSRPWVSR